VKSLSRQRGDNSVHSARAARKSKQIANLLQQRIKKVNLLNIVAKKWNAQIVEAMPSQMMAQEQNDVMSA
jgi:hypothetical protein